MKFKKTQVAIAVASVVSLVAGNIAYAQAERVTVTGSNIKRTSKEGSSPIETITAVDIQRTGAKSVLELMKTVTALGADGFSDTPSQNGFSQGVATASLRTLGATSTLILINGRRMTPSAYANPNNGTSTLYDLNTIPLSAIERVEIFKDGASAVYGSDAIGGVINFITKSDYQGMEMNVRSGFNDDGEFARRGVTFSAGFGDVKSDGWNVLVSADFNQRDRTLQKDGSNDIFEHQYRQINLRGNPLSSSLSASPQFYKENGTADTAPDGTLRFPTSTTASGNPSAATVWRTNLANCPANRQLSPTNATAPALGLALTSALNNNTFCNYDLDQFNEMQGKGDDTALLARGTMRLGASATGFAEVGYSKSDRTFLAGSRAIDGLTPTTSFLVGGTTPSFQLVLPIGHPDNPFNADATPRAAAVRMRFENIPAGTELSNEQTRAVFGFKGNLGSWDYEVATLYNRTERSETRYGFYRLPILRQIVDGTNRTLASVAADPNLSPPLNTTAYAEIMQYDGKVSTEFGNLPGGPIGFAAGMEFRTESIGIFADPLHAAGQILGFATTQINGERDVKSAFFEFRTPWLKNFEMDFAGRFDSYPGIKTSFVPKVGAKWTATDAFVLRGTYAEGFRAPAVSQVTPGGAQFFNNGLFDPLRCEDDGVTPKPGANAADCSKSVAGAGAANPALTPETAKSYSLGAIYSPTSNIDVLLDWFSIEKKGEVALGSAQDALDNPTRYPPGTIVRDTSIPLLLTDGNGVPIPGTGPLLFASTPWTNQGSTAISGIDFEFKLRTSLAEYGKLTSSVKGTYLLSYEREEIVGLPKYNVVGTNGGLSDWATSVGSIPRLKMRISSAWEMGGHTVIGAVNHVSKINHVRRYDGSATPPEEYSGQTCHWGGTNFDGITGRSVLGVAPTATNGRNLYINYYPDCTVPAWTTYDLGYIYKGIKDLTLGIQINNILDTKAPYAPSTTAGTILDGANLGLHNNTGRYFLLSAGYKFK
jgi:iron complex outermembrane recepter protein